MHNFLGAAPLESVPWTEYGYGQDVTPASQLLHTSDYPASSNIDEQSVIKTSTTTMQLNEHPIYDLLPNLSADTHAPNQHEQCDKLPSPVAELFKPRGVPCFHNNFKPISNLWSPDGIAWMKDKTQDFLILSLIREVGISRSKSSASLGLHGSGTSNSLMTSSPTALPSEQEAYMVLSQYFQHFNSHHPIFDERIFMNMVRSHFNGVQSSTPAWLACLHVTLAIGQRCLAMLTPSARSEIEEDLSFDLFDCAMKLLPDLLLATPSLLGVQALLAMVRYLCQI